MINSNKTGADNISEVRPVPDMEHIVDGQCDCACQQSGSMLSVWMHVTDQCNLRCEYCYLPHNSSTMTLETGYAIINSAFRSALIHNYKTVKIKYAGGEPFLQFPLILALHSHAQSLANQSGKSLDGIILTNGSLLTPEKLESMKQAGLRLMISIDGINNYHDIHRHKANGEGTFNIVMESVKAAIASGIIPEISITVSNRNIDGLAEVISWVLIHDLPFSINYYRKNELTTNNFELDLEEKRVVDGMLAVFKVIEKNLPKRSLLTSLMDRANLSFQHDYPCAVGKDYLVFDPSGQVAKCQMDIKNTFTDYKSDDPLAILREHNTGLINPPVDDKDGCKECQWRYYCAGGCPLQAFQSTGKYSGKSPNCNIYKSLYPEVIRLEKLRREVYV